MTKTTTKRDPKFKSQEEADAYLAEHGESHPKARAAREPLDFVPGEHPKQRALRLKILHGIVE
jgi:hypothetical protein